MNRIKAWSPESQSRYRDHMVTEKEERKGLHCAVPGLCAFAGTHVIRIALLRYTLLGEGCWVVIPGDDQSLEFGHGKCLIRELTHVGCFPPTLSRIGQRVSQSWKAMCAHITLSPCIVRHMGIWSRRQWGASPTSLAKDGSLINLKSANKVGIWVFFFF